MKILDRIETQLFHMSRLWGLGDLPLGRPLAPILAIPLALGMKAMHWASVDTYYVIYILFVLTCFVSSFIGFKSMPFERLDSVVIQKIPGILLAFFCVPFRLPALIVTSAGFVILHLFISRYIASRQIMERYLSNIFQPLVYLEKFFVELLACLVTGLISGLIYNILNLSGMIF